MAYKRMKPVRRAGTAPENAQFAADFRRSLNLTERGRWIEAQAALENLNLRYPKRLEPLSLLLNVAQAIGNGFYYIEILERMQKLEPNNADLALSYAAATVSVGQSALALKRFGSFIARWPEHKEAGKARTAVAELQEDLAAMMDTAGLLGENRFELAARNDEVQALMMQARYAEARNRAEQLLEDAPRYTPTLNNLTMISLLEGQPEQAATTARLVLEFAPDNVHALGNLARCLFLLGRMEESATYAEKMMVSQEFATDKITKIAETLSFLGRDEEVLALYRDRPQEQTDPTRTPPMLHHLAGAAALRLGHEAEARRCWKAALKLDSTFDLARENLADLNRPVGERNGPWAFSLPYWIPENILRDFGKRVASGDDATDRKNLDGINVLLQTHPFIRTIVPVLLERGDVAGRQFALFVARAAQLPELLSALRDFVLSQHGSDQMRMETTSTVVRAGLIGAGMVRMWIGGKWEEVMLMGWELHGEPTHNHSPRVEKLAEQAVYALQKRDGKRAEKLLQEAIKIEPESPDLLNNLAMAYQVQGRRDEATELMTQIPVVFPDYFFAKISTANLRREEGRLDEAENILRPLLSLPRLHFSEFAALAQSYIDLWLARGETDHARQMYEMWKQALPDHHAMARYHLIFANPDPLKPGLARRSLR